MLGDTVHPHEQPSSLEQASSPLSAQLLEFCESELFPETIQNSEVASSSNCCYDDQSSYTTNVSIPPDIIINPAAHPPIDIDNSNATRVSMATGTTTTNNLSLILEEEITENNLSLYPFGHQDQFDLILLQNHISLTMDHNNTIDAPYHHPHPNDLTIRPALPPVVCQDDCRSSIPPASNCSFMDPSINSYLSRNANLPLPVESSGIFNGNLFLGNDLIQPYEFDFNGENNGGIFCLDSLPRTYNSNELQTLSNESQHRVNGATPLASEITSLEAETFRVTNKLTREERKEKIHRYMKKRNQRNFNKKIKYACRKTLADSRPRVRGRFAKNDEFGENNRTTCINHEEDTDEDVKSFHVVIKEEDENFESSDIFAHISGVNSLKCNYPIQSWI